MRKKLEKNEKKIKKIKKMKTNEVLGCVMVLARVMVLACDGWRRGSHGLSARRA